MLVIAIGIMSSLATIIFLNSYLTIKMRKWRKRMENKQLDNEIRLDLIEYNHLHEEGNLVVFYLE